MNSLEDLNQPAHDKLTEFEDDKPPKKKSNPAFTILIGVLFIGLGIFRLNASHNSGSSLSNILGWILIAWGTIRIGSTFLKK